MRLYRWHAGEAAAIALAIVAGSAAGSAQPVADAPSPKLAQAADLPLEKSTQPPSEPAATVLGTEDVRGILGRQVRSSSGEDMGRMIDVLVDRNGQLRAAVIDFGGFLGVGNRKIAVDWNALHFEPLHSRDERITLELTRDQVKAAPEYKAGQPLVVLGTAESLSWPPPD
ncbi:MAG TPA: PRC-barrel domain-containing protein [Xanthobacteraceae bacterium]|jgi:hypothetical protein